MMILTPGCSVNRIRGNRNYRVSNEIIIGNIFENTKKQNITRNNIFIQKAEIEISNKEGTKRLLGTLKFEKPDKYLISIKSIAGIEAARIFISFDTILINDKISKKQYFGTPQYLKRKYGITTSVLPVILGDYINDDLSENRESKCLDGKLENEGIISGIRIKYIIDCKKGKSILASPENSSNEGSIEIQYSDFFEKGSIIIPGKIEIRDFTRATTIVIKIRKIESPWDGSIKFVQGNRYEIIKLI